MANLIRTLSLAKRGVRNYLAKRPLAISFEVTHSCNANCKHCHLGGFIKDEKLATPERFGDLCQELQPVVAQLSGGEPLIRKDLEQIIKYMRRPNRAPYIVITTNGIMLNRKRYESLRTAGVDQFSVSLDFPDERHDDFRGSKGLFHRIEKLAKELTTLNGTAITLLTVVQRENFRDLIKIVKLATSWGVGLNFSTYTWLRTNDKNYLLAKDDIEEFKEIVKQLLTLRNNYRHFFDFDYTFNRMIRFFEDGTHPNCKAGEKFFNINPDGTFSPCGLIITKHKTRQELNEKFSKTNTCTACYTSIRSNCEKPIKYLIKDITGKL